MAALMPFAILKNSTAGCTASLWWCLQQSSPGQRCQEPVTFAVFAKASVCGMIIDSLSQLRLFP